MRLRESTDRFVNDGDYAIIRLIIRGCRYNSYLVRYDGRIYLMSNHSRFAGARYAQEAFRLTLYSYYLGESTCSLKSVLRMTDFTMNGASVELVEDLDMEQKMNARLQELYPDMECFTISSIESSSIESPQDFNIDIRRKPRRCSTKRVKDGKSSKNRIEVDLDIRFKDGTSTKIFERSKSNWFYLEPSTNNFHKIRTESLPSESIRSKSTWEPLINALRGRAISWDCSEANIIVRISKKVLGCGDVDEKVQKLFFFYHNFIHNTSLSGSVFGRDSYKRCAIKTVAKNVSLLGTEVLRDRSIKEMLVKELEETKFNVDNSELRVVDEWIEFMQGRGSLNYSRIAAIIEFCEFMCKYVAHTPWHQLNYDDFLAFLRTQKISDELKGKLYRYL